METSNQQPEFEQIYYYTDKRGVKYWTPNPDYAYSRATFFGTKNVYVERFRVVKTENM